MKKILFQIAYKILGPDLSSMLAYGLLGKLYLKTVFKNPNQEQIFNSKENIKLILTPNEASLLGLIYFGTINREDTEFLKNKLNSGDIFFDIGAYIDGWHGLLASKLVGSKGKVYSFEPHPEFYKRLLKNVKLNNMKNIKVEKMAVSNKTGHKTFYSQKNISSFYKDHITKNIRASELEAKPFKVKTITLDEYIRIKKIRKISFVKIDVECAEMEVLLGAKKMLTKPNAPDLLIEAVDSYQKTAGYSKKDLIKYIKSFGYIEQPIINSLNIFFSKKKII